LAERHIHRAIEAYGRVLTLEPEHPVALERIRSLHSGQRRRRIAGMSSLLIAAVTVTWATIAFWPVSIEGNALKSVDRPAKVPSVPTTVNQAPENPAPEFSDPGRSGVLIGFVLGEQIKRVPQIIALGNRPNRPNRPRNPSSTKRAPEKPRIKNLVRLTAEPPAVKITVDGQPVNAGSIQRLSPGKHRVVLTHPACGGCGPTVRTVVVPEKPGAEVTRVHYKFKYEPAIIRVDCSNGKVSIDGKVYGDCGKAYRVAVLSHKPRAVMIEARFPDGGKKSQKVTIKPGAKVRWSAGR